MTPDEQVTLGARTVLDIVTNKLTDAAAKWRDMGGAYTADEVADYLTAVSADIRATFNETFVATIGGEPL